MSLIDVGLLMLPDLPRVVDNFDYNFSATALNSSTAQRLAWYFLAARGRRINTIGFRIAGVTTAQDLRVSVQTVNTLSPSAPSGIVGAAVVLPSASVTVGWKELSGFNALLTVGTVYAIVFEWDSTLGSITINYWPTQAGRAPWDQTSAFETYNGTVWAKSLGVHPALYLEDDDGRSGYQVGLWPATGNGPSQVSANGDVVALRFKFPGRCRLIGISAALLPGNDEQWAGVLYDDTPSEIVVGPTWHENQGAENGGPAGAWFFAPQLLERDTWYRAGLKTVVSASGSVGGIQVNDAKHLDAWDLGRTFHLAAKLGGTWSLTATKRPSIALLIDQLDVGGVAPLSWSPSYPAIQRR